MTLRTYGPLLLVPPGWNTSRGFFLRSIVKLSLILPILFTSTFACSLTSGQIGFLREHLTVSVSGESCSLDGDYYFKNSASRPAGCSIFYPLISRPDLPYPDSILVLADSASTPIGFEKTSESILFYLDLKPEETRKIRVQYRQRTPLQKFEYILTSTRAWGKPLELAEFRIVVPDSFQLTSCSPSYDTNEKNGHTMVYHVRRQHFMPTSNLSLQWTRRAR